MTSDCRKLATLGLVGKLVKHTRPENFDKLVRYLSSWSGTDKVFYSTKILETSDLNTVFYAYSIHIKASNMVIE